ncbi:MAG: haloacid dehalogenase-like hydrolase [Leptonema sp. (in: Bacteria)]|nr:haloacid dehalogenase-like hydrolase [Leptonema sp. (in: bacteria)]
MNQAYWSEPTYKQLINIVTGPVGLAAFDFDHTLIQGDQGEALMNYIVLSGKTCANQEWFWQDWPKAALPKQDSLKKQFDAYNHYADPLLLAQWADSLIDVYELIRNQHGNEAAYRWSSIFFAGLTESEIGDLSIQVFERELSQDINSIVLPSGRELPIGLRIRPQMKELVADLLNRGWQVFIVTASPQIPISVLSHYWGLSSTQVIGMNLKTNGNGLLTSKIIEPYPCAKGKVTALRQITDAPLLLAAGDSVMDLQLLEEAKNALVLDRGSVTLRNKAQEKGWIIETSKLIV